jgi:hypothetical protein
MTQHSVRVDDLDAPSQFRPLATRFAGFEGSSMADLVNRINTWLTQNPDAKLIGWQHGFSIASEDYYSYTALLEYRR